MNPTVLVILTDDYEIFGNGSGDIDCCLIKPTEKLLKLCGNHGVPVTLFADIAEYWAFEEEEKKGSLPKDYLPATKMRNQLISAVQSGHDVQLHLHPQWLNYRYDDQKGWQVDLNLWRLPALPHGDVNDRKSLLGALCQAKKTLENMLKPFHEDYRCIAFRAGAWCIQPESKVLESLRHIGIRIDSTVAPGLSRDDGLTIFNFRELLALFKKQAYWYVAETLFNTSSKGDGIMEVPILTVPFYFHQRVINRIKRRRLGLLNPPLSCRGTELSKGPQKKSVLYQEIYSGIVSRMTRQIMADINVLTAEEMYSAVKKAAINFQGRFDKIPLVYIGHSKGLGEENLKELDKFIVKAKKRGILFGTYKDILAWENG